MNRTIKPVQGQSQEKGIISSISSKMIAYNILNINDICLKMELYP